MIAAKVLPVSLSIPEKLLTVDDPVPKELVKQPKNQAKYNTRSKPKPEGETLVISDPDKCVSNIALFTLVLNPFWISLPRAYVQPRPIKLIIILLPVPYFACAKLQALAHDTC